MRTLVIGVGAIGGYFGGRLLEANQEVTFLVRPRRAAELASSGLTMRSRFGDATVSKPPTMLAENLRATFDLVLLSGKAYDLEGAMASFFAHDPAFSCLGYPDQRRGERASQPGRTMAPWLPVSLRHGRAPADTSATRASRGRRAPGGVEGDGGAVMSGAPGCPRPGSPARPSSPRGAPLAAGGTSRTRAPVTRRPVRARRCGSAG